MGVFADPLAFAEGDDSTPGSRNEPHSAFQQVVALISGLFPDAHPSMVKPSDDVITKSLGQVKDDSQILLLKNLSSQRGGKGSASSASSSTQRHPRLKLRLKILHSPPRDPFIVLRGVVNGQTPRRCSPKKHTHQNAYAIPAPEGSVGVFADPLAFAEGDDSTPGSRNEPHSAFQQVVALISGLFPDAHPSMVKPSDPASWFRGFGDEKQRDPKVFLSCFDRIRSIMADVEERSTIAAKGVRRQLMFCLPGVRFIG